MQKYIKSQKNKKKTVVLCIILCVIIILLIVNAVCNEFIFVKNYTVESEKINDNIRVVSISDLHNKDFCNNNKQLVDKIKSQNPDIITVLGDMVTCGESDYETAISLLCELKKIAPVYYSLGNHELDYNQKDKLCSAIKSTGITLLDNEIKEITIKDTKIKILGLSYYIFDTSNFPKTTSDFYVNLMDNFCSGNDYKLLLCHYPEYSTWFFQKDKYFVYNFDLMLSGHTHGGLIQIPFIGGLFAPNQGYFPKYDKGMFDVKVGTHTYKMIINGGLGNSEAIPRVNNPPEINVIDLKPLYPY